MIGGSIRRVVHTASNKGDAVAKWLTVTSAIMFTLLVFLAVLTRYVLRVSLIFSVEISKLLFVWSAFLAATVAYKRKAHIRFEFLNALLGPRGIAVTDLILYLFALAFFQTLLRNGIRFTRIVWPTYLPVLGLSQGWLYMAVNVSAVLFILHTLSLLITAVEDVRDSFSLRHGRASS